MTSSTPPSPSPAGGAAERVLCLLFRAGGERFAIRAADVQRVTPASQISRLPRLPPALLGITQHRGRVVTVVDAAPLLCSAGRIDSPDSRLLFLERPIRHVSLLVDVVDEIESLRLPTDLSQLQRGGRPGLRIAQQRGRALPLIDVAALVAQVNALME